MSSRLDAASENVLVNTISRLRDDADDLRSRQSVQRTLVKRSYQVSTTLTYDLTADTVAAGQVKLYRINFVGMNLQANPYGVQYSQVYNGSTLLSDRSIADSTGAYYTWYPVPVPDSNRLAWIISFVAGSSAASVSIKIRVLSTTKGSNLFITW